MMSTLLAFDLYTGRIKAQGILCSFDALLPSADSESVKGFQVPFKRQQQISPKKEKA